MSFLSGISSSPAIKDQAATSVTEWLLHDDQIMRECFRHATEILKHVTGASLTAVTLLDADHQHYCGEVGGLSRPVPRASSLCEHALHAGGVFVIEDTLARQDVQMCSLVRSPPYVRFYAAVPLRLPDGEIVGALCAMDPSPRKMDDSARSVLRHLGEIIESDLRLRMASAVDPLTQLFNRRSTLDGILQRWHSLHDGDGVGAVMIDIDWFKQYNDTYGHLVGDACLRSVAAVLRDTAEEHETIAGRVGGEEFALLLTHMDRADVLIALERVRAAVERLDIEHRGSPLGKVTLSLGACHVWRNGPADHGHREAFRAADRALYRAKELGRNRVQMA